MAEPTTVFDPLRAPKLARRWSVAPGPDWPERYLEQARTRAGAGGSEAYVVMWDHLRWLVGVFRRGEEDERSDAEVIQACLPDPRYIYFATDDPAAQAMRWYLARHPELGEGSDDPDFQEVRWLETLVIAQSRGWAAFFDLHGIAPYRVDAEDLDGRSGPTVVAVLQWLGLAAGAGSTEGAGATARPGPGRPAAAGFPTDVWLERYKSSRPRLNGHVGVRTARR